MATASPTGHQEEEQVGVVETVSHKAPKAMLLHFENQRCNPPLLPWRLSGVYCLEGVPGKWGKAAGGGRKPLQMSHLPRLQSLVPQSRSPHASPTPTHAGKTVSWQSGLKAKPNTLSVPRLHRRLAPRGPVCSELTGPLEWGRTPLPERKAGPHSSLLSVPACCVTLGKSCPLGLSFPMCTEKEQE